MGEADVAIESGALENDGAVVALPHHAAAHPHPAAHRAVHPHPAAHVVRVDERAERRTARRIVHHEEKHSSGTPGPAPATTSLPPCRSIPESEAGEEARDDNAEEQRFAQDDDSEAEVA